jgi:hypothetical protein
MVKTLREAFPELTHRQELFLTAMDESIISETGVLTSRKTRPIMKPPAIH